MTKVQGICVQWSRREPLLGDLAAALWVPVVPALAGMGE